MRGGAVGGGGGGGGGGGVVVDCHCEWVCGKTGVCFFGGLVNQV